VGLLLISTQPIYVQESSLFEIRDVLPAEREQFIGGVRARAMKKFALSVTSDVSGREHLFFLAEL
jgi:hypothetical protein